MFEVLSQSVLSLKYVQVPVYGEVNGVVHDPTADTVQMAFPVQGVDPVSGDLKTASWEVDTTQTPNVYYARCLVGPGGSVVLAVGRYDIWIKITDSPEQVYEKVGVLKIT